MQCLPGTDVRGTCSLLGIEGFDLVGVLGVDAAALEFGGGGELFGVGEPFVAEDGDLLDALGVVELGHGVGEAAFDLFDDGGVGGEVGQRREGDVVGAGPRRRGVGV